MQLPAFTFNSDDFPVRNPLPAVDVSGLAFPSQPEVDPDHFLEVARSAGGTSVILRSRQELAIGAMQLGFAMDSAGEVSGHLSGRVRMSDPPALERGFLRLRFHGRS